MSLTEENASNKIVELEIKYNLFDFQLDNYCIWRLLKNEASINLNNFDFYITKKKRSKLKIFLTLFKGSIQDVPALFKISQKKYFVKTYSSVLRELENKKWKDVEFDYLLKDLGNCFKIEVKNSPNFNKRSKNALIPINMSTNIIDFLTLFLSKIVKINKIENSAKLFYLNIKNEPLLQNLDLKKIKMSLYNFYWSKFFYKIILLKVKPEFVFLSNTSEYSLIAASSELNIKSIEFQHGVFTSYHKDVFKDHAISFKNKLIIPNKILLFGEYWLSYFNNLQFYKDILCVIGSPKIDYYRNIQNEIIKTKNYIDILVTTQGYAIDDLIKFINDFIFISNNKLICNLYIKLHPGYDYDTSLYINNFSQYDNVFIIAGDEEPSTFDLLLNSDYHLSISSACHFDALGLGVPTIILALKNYETILEIHNKNFAFLANTPQELFDYIIKTKNEKIKTDHQNYFFKSNALKNTLNILNEG
jgi:hypothetical protein